MGTCKAKADQEDLGICRHFLAYSDIFRDNYVYSGIIQAYSGIFRTLCNAGIFKTMGYSEPWNIQDPTYIHNPVKHLRWCVL